MSEAPAKKAKLEARSITIGTDMISSVITLQKARPWYMDDKEGSNLAKDNEVSLKEIFDGSKVAVFGVPAPFTGTCTNEHWPGYNENADAILKEADKLICYAVSDPYAHHAWGKALGNDFSKIEFLADDDGSFAKAYGLEFDCNVVSLGTRAKRFSMFVDNGNVKFFQLVEDAKKDAATLLQGIKDLKDE
ncbi:Peroxiredoxin-5, mitochondrial [Seminavis robusta]|uniref:Peroxiredoxin-5, mitochondrial n=1 Tax=Seminavis robusta TaxID=568900 RepID=A0A9N8EBG3_9STRA|nr:Peroxiredoxin-5, mitochondrial [Seminavis robusta]|eukprot:Sro763_g198940.1 Peroxiredoxin-5, mitochondrial (190) ;mRNA; r:34268-34837